MAPARRDSGDRGIRVSCKTRPYGLIVIVKLLVDRS